MMLMNRRMMLAGSCVLVVACGGGGADSAGSTGPSGATTDTEDTGVTGTSPTSTTGVPTTGATGSGASESQTGDATSTGGISVTEATEGTTSPGTTSGMSGGTGDTGSTTDEPPPEKQCSADFHAVVDEQGNLLETCAPEQGCADGACIAACDAAAASKANFGCAFLVPTPPAYPPALPPCFAVFLANTVRPNPPRRPRTSRSAAIPGKRALWRGWARPTLAQRAPVRPGFWQRFGNALATRDMRQTGHGAEIFDTVRARPVCLSAMAAGSPARFRSA